MSELMTELAINNNLDNTTTDDSTNSWLSSLPEDLKTSPSLSKFKDISSLAQSYLEAEKSLNHKISIPKDDALPEEWNKFYTKLGLPEDKRYLDQRATEDEEYITAYEDMFYQNGLSRKQGAKLLESMYKYSSDLQQKQQEELEQVRNSNTDWLQKTYGNEFDAKMSLMQASLSKFGTKELASLIEDSNYSPALVDLLVKVGGTLQSDSLVTGATKAGVNSSESALSEIKKLESDDAFMVKLRDKNHIAHDEAVKKMEELYNLAYNKD